MSTFYHFGLQTTLRTLFGPMSARTVMEQMDLEIHTVWNNGHYVLLPRNGKLVLAYNNSKILNVKDEVATVQKPADLEEALSRAGKGHVVVPVKPFLPEHNGKLVYRVHPVNYQG